MLALSRPAADALLGNRQRAQESAVRFDTLDGPFEGAVGLREHQGIGTPLALQAIWQDATSSLSVFRFNGSVIVPRPSTSMPGSPRGKQPATQNFADLAACPLAFDSHATVFESAICSLLVERSA